MIKYIVKSTEYATEENVNFKGEVRTYFNGVKDTLIGVCDGKTIPSGMTTSAIKRYGYNRLCDARRCYSFTHPENSRWWKTEVEIIAVDV